MKTLQETLQLATDDLGEFKRMFLEPKGYSCHETRRKVWYIYLVPHGEQIALRHLITNGHGSASEAWRSVEVPPQLCWDAMDEIAMQSSLRDVFDLSEKLVFAEDRGGLFTDCFRTAVMAVSNFQNQQENSSMIKTEYGNLRIEQIWQTSDKNFRVWDSDEKEPHLLAEVWYSDMMEQFVLKFTDKDTPYIQDEVLSIISFVLFKNSNVRPSNQQEPK